MFIENEVSSAATTAYEDLVKTWHHMNMKAIPASVSNGYLNKPDLDVRKSIIIPKAAPTITRICSSELEAGPR
jgi:hypothetical protein